MNRLLALCALLLLLVGSCLVDHVDATSYKDLANKVKQAAKAAASKLAGKHIPVLNKNGFGSPYYTCHKACSVIKDRDSCKNECQHLRK